MSRSAGRRSSPGSGRPRWLLILGASVLFAVGIYFGIQVGKPPPPPDLGHLRAQAPTGDEASSSSVPDGIGDQAEATENPSDARPAAPSPTMPAAPTSTDVEAPGVPGRPPRIAIIIDDLGRSLRDLEVLESLGVPLTYSVLPFETKTAEVVAALRRRGAEMLCHLPMEAKGGADPGPGALLGGMSKRELRAATRRALDAVPGAVGVNNHMGSAIAGRREAIEPVLEVLVSQGLFFIDSRTSIDTVAYAVARELGLPSAERQVFLDNDRDPAAIRAQFHRLLEIARARGEAIAIGHPYAETLGILAEELPALHDAGIEVVAASALLERG